MLITAEKYLEEDGNHGETLTAGGGWGNKVWARQKGSSEKRKGLQTGGSYRNSAKKPPKNHDQKNPESIKSSRKTEWVGGREEKEQGYSRGMVHGDTDLKRGSHQKKEGDQ